MIEKTKTNQNKPIGFNWFQLLTKRNRNKPKETEKNRVRVRVERERRERVRERVGVRRRVERGVTG